VSASSRQFAEDVPLVQPFRGSVGGKPRFDQRVAPTRPVDAEPCRFSDSRSLRERASAGRAATISPRKSTYLAENMIPHGAEDITGAEPMVRRGPGEPQRNPTTPGASPPTSPSCRSCCCGSPWGTRNYQRPSLARRGASCGGSSPPVVAPRREQARVGDPRRSGYAETAYLNREDLLSWPPKRIVSCAFVRSRR